MKIKKYHFPDNLYYDTNHFWAKIKNDNTIIIGTTDMTQKMAGDITFVDIPEEGDPIKQGKPFGSIESGKWVGRVYAPISGIVIEGNEDLEDEPELINQDCYGEGWICKIKPANLKSDLNNLMQISFYEKWIEQEIIRIEESAK